MAESANEEISLCIQFAQISGTISTAIDEIPSLLMSQLYKAEIAISFLLGVSTVLKGKEKVFYSGQWWNICEFTLLFTFLLLIVGLGSWANNTYKL